MMLGFFFFLFFSLNNLSRNRMGLVHITRCMYSKFNRSHFDLPPSSIHRMTGLGGNFMWTMTYVYRSYSTTLDKKRTILEIHGEKNAVPRVISCSIRRDQRRAKVADSRGSDLPCADRAWSSMITHVEQRSSRRESRWWFFFFVQGSILVLMKEAQHV